MLVFFKSKREPFQASFCSKENQILEFSDIQVSWRHQMPKHKTKNTFYWINLEVYKVLMKFGRFMCHYKIKKFIQKFYKNCNLKTSSMSFCVRNELSTTSIGKWNFWSKLLILDMCHQNYQNLSKSADFFIFFFTEDSLKKFFDSFQVPFFIEFIDKIFFSNVT